MCRIGELAPVGPAPGKAADVFPLGDDEAASASPATRRAPGPAGLLTTLPAHQPADTARHGRRAREIKHRPARFIVYTRLQSRYGGASSEKIICRQNVTYSAGFSLIQRLAQSGVADDRKAADWPRP